ncbi:MAG: response regulator [Chloroflexi bacterium]|nr:response regulator [Chloroflexota bacterium]
MDERPLALIVEDNEDLSFIFGEALREAGYQIELIRDGQEAASYLETNHPLVVILDLHLPGVAGTEILKQIRTSDHLKDVRVVVTTADARLAEQLSQADFVLIKPISFSLLRDLTSRLSEGNRQSLK